MPIGLKNVAQTFQHFIDEVVRFLLFVFSCVADILMASTSFETHVEHLRLLFHRLQSYGLVINVTKCDFGASIEFLGHLLNGEGILPLPSKIEAITNIPRPTSMRQLLRFVALVTFREVLVRLVLLLSNVWRLS